MFKKYQDYETAATVVFGILFFVLEKFNSTRHIDRRSQIKTDIQSFLLLIVSINISRAVLNMVFNRADVLNFFVFLKPVHKLPSFFKVLIGLCTIDFITYWIHRGMHTWRVLWHTHEWHHSSPILYWFSGFRTSFFHAFIFAIPQVFFAFYVFNLSMREASFAFGLGTFFQFWTHSNITVQIPIFEKLILTPQYHRIHHSKGANQNKNFSFYLTLWDRLFGTYVDPASVSDDYKIGLSYERSKAKMMVGV